MVRILILEDEIGWQDVIVQYLLDAFSLEGYPEPSTYPSDRFQENGYPQSSICIAKAYEEAKPLLNYAGFWDLLVADLALNPDPSRLTLAKNQGILLIESAKKQDIPTIVVSGTATGFDIRNLLLSYGVIDCFPKENFSSLVNDFSNHVRRILSLKKQKIQPNKDNISLLPSLNRGFALLIGVANYSYITSLDKTKIDAQDLGNVLKNSGYLPENVHVLLDQEATKMAISEKLDLLANLSNEEDTVIVFFSGHGLQRVGGFNRGEYLCPVEAKISDLESSCISSKQLTDALSAIKAERLVVFLDACHSGGVGEVKDSNLRMKGGLSEQGYVQLVKGKGRVVIASSRADEPSWELREDRNGLFTRFLLEGLRGGAARLDGTIPIIRLFDYISDKVSQYKDQHPFITSATENFVIAVQSSVRK
ncbi:MAG: caspase family protein [Cyanothece sp. SIO1E1]|nr:caspase family protein [Cyanothece sp. SIO1E1]